MSDNKKTFAVDEDFIQKTRDARDAVVVVMEAYEIMKQRVEELEGKEKHMQAYLDDARKRIRELEHELDTERRTKTRVETSAEVPKPAPEDAFIPDRIEHILPKVGDEKVDDLPWVGMSLDRLHHELTVTHGCALKEGLPLSLLQERLDNLVVRGRVYETVYGNYLTLGMFKADGAKHMNTVALAKKVLEIIRVDNAENDKGVFKIGDSIRFAERTYNGCHIKDIVEKLTVTVKAVRAAVDHLLDEMLIYTTITPDHLRAVEQETEKK